MVFTSKLEAVNEESDGKLALSVDVRLAVLGALFGKKLGIASGASVTGDRLEGNVEVGKDVEVRLLAVDSKEGYSGKLESPVGNAAL